jgi:hypothetical protein
VKIKCNWCGKPNRTASDWEQERLRGGWARLCVRCANRRLNNPFCGLLHMRRIEPATVTTQEQS